ncbi:hypothetical protein SAMN05444166_6311 [Singulisphaera sp. GP187]|nr:hypothetical protein SAMN05444166_6311 [Singulisphaera sp. GP187]
MTDIEREALELARRKCVGRYTIRHIEAWVRLAERGLVHVVRDDSGSWYELTDLGSDELGIQEPARAPGDGMPTAAD